MGMMRLSPEEISQMLSRVQHDSQDKTIDEYHEMQQSAMQRLDLVIRKLNSLEKVSKRQTQYIDVLESRIVKMNKKFDKIRNLKVSDIKEGVIDDMLSDDSSDQFTVSDNEDHKDEPDDEKNDNEGFVNVDSESMEQQSRDSDEESQDPSYSMNITNSEAGKE